MQKWVLMLFLVLPSEAFAAGDQIVLHDWQAKFENTNQRATCLIQTTGINKNRRILLTLNLSVLVEKGPLLQKKETTIIKVAVGQIKKPDLSEITPMKIDHAWIITSLGTSVGKTAKVESPEPSYLGGSDGSELFHQLLQGVLKDGATVGFQEKATDPEILSILPAPPASVMIEKLIPCLANVLPDVDIPI